MKKHLMKLFATSIILLLFFSLTCHGQNTAKNSDAYSEPEIIRPSFSGGYDSLRSFIKRNLKYPGGGLLCCDGAVYVSFIVNEDGKLSDFEIVKGSCGQLFNKSGIDVIKKMPKWIPGSQNDRKVKVRCVYPVKFS